MKKKPGDDTPFEMECNCDPQLTQEEKDKIETVVNETVEEINTNREIKSDNEKNTKSKP